MTLALQFDFSLSLSVRLFLSRFLWLYIQTVHVVSSHYFGVLQEKCLPCMSILLHLQIDCSLN